MSMLPAAGSGRPSCDERRPATGVICVPACGGCTACIMLAAMGSDEKRPGGGRRPRRIKQPDLPPGPLADLKALLYELYLGAGIPALTQIAAWVRADDELAGAPGRDTINRVIGGAALPPSQEDVVAAATVLARAARRDPGDVAGRARELWVAAQLAASAAVPEPDAAPAIRPGEVLVAEANLRRLGVHAAITVPGVPDDQPPEYVPRDIDDQVRVKLAAAAAKGGFVLLVGDSSAGKTRCAAEAVKAVLPDWRLVHPAGPAEIAALAAAKAPRTVVWLDELQRYLGGEHGLTGGVVRAFLDPPHAAVIIATLWPHWYNLCTTLPDPAGTDSHARERAVLALADVISIAPEFTNAEQDQARAAAGRDRRLAVALGTTGYGLTQTLAAAPQLVARWETADPYARAVMTAALDAARLGARAPLSAAFLRAAAPGYCTSQQQAEAPESWLHLALANATGKLAGAASALSAGGAAMGQISGYAAADYLIQYVGQKRHHQRVPASTWDAAITHIRDLADAERLADSARNRLLYRYAIPLYRAAADASTDSASWSQASWSLAQLLAWREDTDGLRARADAGDVQAAARLAELLFKRADERALESWWVCTGNKFAADYLNRLKIARENVSELRRPADLHLLAMCQDADSLRVRADAGNSDASFELAELLVEQEDVAGLEARADAGDQYAASWLAGLLARRGNAGKLQTRAGAGDEYAAAELADLLAEREDAGKLQRLRASADDDIDTGEFTGFFAEELADLLIRRGDVGELRARADAGDQYAAAGLANLLTDQDDVDGLRDLVDAGIDTADKALVQCLARRGLTEEAMTLRWSGLNPDGSIAGK